MWIPTWLRLWTIRWSNSVELAAASRREQRLSAENLRTHGMLADALEEIRTLRDACRRATENWAAEQQAHSSTAERLGRMTVADRKRTVARHAELELSNDRLKRIELLERALLDAKAKACTTQCQDIAQEREQLKAEIRELHGAPHAQSAGA